MPRSWSLIATALAVLIGTCTAAEVKTLRDVDAVQRLGKLQSGYRIHFIDVGTGLAVLVEGVDFRLLFDAGSGDDKKGNTNLGSGSRVVAYLNAALGASSNRRCQGLGDVPPTFSAATPVLTHVVLSHAHEDHISHMVPVLECFRAKHVWEPGAPYPSSGYHAFQEAVFNSSARYHAGTERCSPTAPEHCAVQFDAGKTFKLGKDAKATVLHVNPNLEKDANRNSIVLRLDLGSTSVLLTGDAESGERAAPDAELGDIEATLVENFHELLDVDILQVGHHGSKTSSRLEFLDAVSPKLAVISAGPKKYKTVVLPDQVIVDALRDVGAKIYRTDLNDAACPVDDKIGVNDGGPGGCDNIVISVP